MTHAYIRVITRTAATLAFALLMGRQSLAVGVPSFDLRRLVDDSDLIVVGQIANAREIATDTRELRSIRTRVHILEAEVIPDEVPKGHAIGPVHFRFVVPDTFLGYAAVTPNKYRVVFLKRNGEILEPTSPYYPTLPVAKGAGSSSEAIESVAASIAGILLSPTADEFDKAEAAYRLRNVRTDAVTSALKVAAKDPSLRVRSLAVADLLARNDISLLPDAISILLSPITPRESRQSIAGAIYEGVHSEIAIPQLTKLLSAPDSQVRQAGMMGIRRCGCPEAVPALVSALDNTDRRTRYLAVVGLAETTGENDWRPLESDFNANESRYVRYWKEWAASH